MEGTVGLPSASIAPAVERGKFTMPKMLYIESMSLTITELSEFYLTHHLISRVKQKKRIFLERRRDLGL